MKRKTYQPKGKMLEPALTSMRETAYGQAMKNLISKVTTKELSEQGEIDKINAAFAKRKRRADKFKKEHPNG